MTISSRTPEGFPSHCPLCGSETNLEFSEPSGDAPCPNCGHLIWLSAQLLSSFRHQFSEAFDISPDQVTVDTNLVDLGADSLDTVELVMTLEEEFDVAIPDDEASRMKTVGEAIRYISEIKSNRAT